MKKKDNPLLSYFFAFCLAAITGYGSFMFYTVELKLLYIYSLMVALFVSAGTGAILGITIYKENKEKLK